MHIKRLKNALKREKCKNSVRNAIIKIHVKLETIIYEFQKWISLQKSGLIKISKTCHENMNFSIKD